MCFRWLAGESFFLEQSMGDGDAGMGERVCGALLRTIMSAMLAVWLLKPAHHDLRWTGSSWAMNQRMLFVSSKATGG